MFRVEIDGRVSFMVVHTDDVDGVCDDPRDGQAIQRIARLSNQRDGDGSKKCGRNSAATCSKRWGRRYPFSPLHRLFGCAPFLCAVGLPCVLGLICRSMFQHERHMEIVTTTHRTQEEQRITTARQKEARISLMRGTREMAAAAREEQRMKAAEALALQQMQDALALQEKAKRREEDVIIAAAMEKILPDREPRFGANVIGGAWIPSPPTSSRPSPRMLQDERRLREAQQKKELARAATLARRKSAHSHYATMVK
jgi:hypothetical protein